MTTPSPTQPERDALEHIIWREALKCRRAPSYFWRDSRRRFADLNPISPNHNKNPQSDGGKG